MNVYESLEKNIQFLDDAFMDCGDIVKRKFPVGEYRNYWAYVFYIDMLVDSKLIENIILKSLMLEIRQAAPAADDIRGNTFDILKDGGIPTADLKEENDFDAITLAVLSGDTVLFIDNHPKAIIISSKGFPNRGIQTAETEVVVQGSKEAFSEPFRINTTLIRRRIRDTGLKVKQMKVGRRSATDVALMYINDIVRPQVLQDAIKRIENIDIDAIQDCGYIEQLIEDDWMSPFPQVQITERPDKAASAILEGRIVIVVDNSPFVLIIPAIMNTFFQAAEDYNQRWQIMSFARIIRYIAGAMALTLPALYIATTVYHPSMLPTLLTFKMTGARQTVPFPLL